MQHVVSSGTRPHADARDHRSASQRHSSRVPGGRERQFVHQRVPTGISQAIHPRDNCVLTWH